jgi:DinB family protein
MNLTEYISELDRNTGDILQLLKECSEEQLEIKQEGSWSILEILEHILITDRSVYNLLLSPSEKQGTAPEVMGRKIKFYMIDKRDIKAIAPLHLLPKGEIKNNAEFIEQFLKQRAFLVDALENNKIIIDNGITSHHVMGDLSKTDWLNFLMHHAERHVLQIKDRLAGTF